MDFVPRHVWWSVFLILILSAGCLQQQTPSSNQTKFKVYQDRLGNPVSSVDVGLPVQKKKICPLMKKACNSSVCENLTHYTTVPEKRRQMLKSSVGGFEWTAYLGKKCGDSFSFVNVSAKRVVCFCTYE